MESNGNSNKNDVHEIKLELERLKSQYGTLEKAVQTYAKREKNAAGQILAGVKELKTHVTDIGPSKDDENIVTLPQVVRTHRLDLPIETANEFFKFDEKIKDIDNIPSVDLVSCLFLLIYYDYSN